MFNQPKKYIKCDIYQIVDDNLTVKVSNFYLDLSDITETKWWNLFNKKYNRSEHCDYLNDIKLHLIKEISTKLGEYKNIIKDDFKTIRDSYISQIKEATKNKANEYEIQQNIILQRIETEIELLNTFIKDLNA